MRRARVILLGALGVFACLKKGPPAATPTGATPGGPQAHPLVDAKTLPEPTAAPALTAVLHLGVSEVAGSAPAGTADGAAVPGEALLISGSQLGRIPEVTVGGVPAAILGRTADGGIVVRVPPAAPIGERAVVVKTAKGASSRSVRIKRFALVAVPRDGKVFVLEVNESDSRRAGELAIETPEDLRFSPDGSVGYVLAGKKGGEWRVHLLDMTAPEGPTARGTAMQRTSDVAAFLVARRAPVAALLDQAGVEIWDVARPLAPKLLSTTLLPQGLAGLVQTAEISPDGKLIAILSNTKNRLVLLRIEENPISGPGVTIAGTALDVLAGVTNAQAVRAVRFAPDGKTIWVVSGTLPGVKAGKKEPARLTAIAVPASGAPTAGKTRALKGAQVPRDFVVTWGRVNGEGGYEPRPPDDVAMILAASPERLFEVDAKEIASSSSQRRRLLRHLGQQANPGVLYQMSADGTQPVALRLPVMLVDVEVTPDSSRVVCFGLETKATDKDVEFEIGVASAPALARPQDGILPTGFISLSKIKPEELRPPFRFGEVRIQP